MILSLDTFILFHLYFPAAGKHDFCTGCLSSSVSEGDSGKADTKTAGPSLLLTAHKESDVWEQLCLCHSTTAGQG